MVKLDSAEGFWRSSPYVTFDRPEYWENYFRYRVSKNETSTCSQHGCKRLKRWPIFPDADTRTIFDCSKHGMDTVQGQTADVWVYSDDTKGFRTRSVMWISQESGLPLQSEHHTIPGTGYIKFKRHIFEFTTQGRRNIVDAEATRPPPPFPERE